MGRKLRLLTAVLVPNNRKSSLLQINTSESSGPANNHSHIMKPSRRVKPQVEDDYEPNEYEHPSDVEVDNDQSDDENLPTESYEQPGAELEDSDGDLDLEDAEPDIDPTAALKSISFGALSKAQASLSKDRRKPTIAPKSSIVAKYHADNAPPPSNARAALEARRAALRAAKEKEGKEEALRASKNAPQEVTAKKAVTRRRNAIAPIKAASQLVRDPRFDTAVNGTFDEQHFRKNYGFLDEYREDEMKMLKAEIKKTRDMDEKEKIKMKLKSMMSQKETQAGKDKTMNVLKEHRKKEREMVKNGKKAYYLKPSEVKRKVLEEQYSKLSERQLESVIERKQKRKAQKEKKNMPWARRGEE